MKKSVILIIALLSSACGYHLRGGLELPKEMKNVYLDGGSPQLRDQFKRALDISSVPLANTPETAGLIVKIYDEDNQRRVLSLSSGGIANDFELSYRFDYELLDSKNKVLMPRQSFEIKREFFNDQVAIIAKGNEESTIRDEMYQQAVRSIVSRARVALEERPK